VIKVISPSILHKSDVGGVKVVANEPDAIAAAIRAMEEQFAGQDVAGYTVNEYVAYDRSLGHELLLGLRWTEDFGPVVTFGPGGIYTEFLSANFRPGRNVAIFSPEIEDDGSIEQTIDRVAVMNLVTGKLRGQPAKIQARAVVPAVSRFMALARRYMPATISECEINPLVVTEHGLVALDILVKLAREVRPSTSARGALSEVEGRKFESPKVRKSDRPVHKLKNLLEPRSVAIIGVSEKLNPGHIILNNLIREGFDRARIAVIKPGSDTLEGCRCCRLLGAYTGEPDRFHTVPLGPNFR
jgi:hypothetical protein